MSAYQSSELNDVIHLVAWHVARVTSQLRHEPLEASKAKVEAAGGSRWQLVHASMEHAGVDSQRKNRKTG